MFGAPNWRPSTRRNRIRQLPNCTVNKSYDSTTSFACRPPLPNTHSHLPHTHTLTQQGWPHTAGNWAIVALGGEALRFLAGLRNSSADIDEQLRA